MAGRSILNLWQPRQASEPHDPIRWSVLRALEKPGCPICRVQREWADRFYFWLVNQNYYVEETIHELKASGDLCREHAERLLELRSVYTTSVMYDYLVDDAAAKLTALANAAAQEIHKPSRKPRRFTSMPSGECPACAEYHEIEQGAVRALIAELDEKERAAKYRESEVLCMPHFHRAVEIASPRVIALLAETQLAKLDALKRDFAEYFRKVDYRFAAEPKGSEQTAWQRAIRRLVGEKR